MDTISDQFHVSDAAGCEPSRALCAAGPAHVVAVCASGGGVPKLPLVSARVVAAGIEGDAHAHEKHRRPDRAISIFDMEILRDLAEEGFPLAPGAIGENLTVRGLRVQAMPAGTLLEIGEVVLRLESARKPCYVLDAIDPRLKEVIVGRCGYMASVVRGGAIRPNLPIGFRFPSATGDSRP